MTMLAGRGFLPLPRIAGSDWFELAWLTPYGDEVGGTLLRRRGFLVAFASSLALFSSLFSCFRLSYASQLGDWQTELSVVDTGVGKASTVELYGIEGGEAAIFLLLRRIFMLWAGSRIAGADGLAKAVLTSMTSCGFGG